MEERHEHEQYFFAEPSVNHLAQFLGRYDSVCALCTPMVGRRLAEAGKNVVTLDLDERFSDVRGFKRWDIHRPERLQQKFDVIVCDPPFFNISLARLFHAIRVLAHDRFEQKLLIAHPRRRCDALLGTFAPFGLESTGFSPTYVSIEKTEHNEVELFGNLGSEAHHELVTGDW